MFFFLCAQAQKVYKWTDENGTIHYSKKAPEKSVVEQVSLSKKRVGDKQCCGMVRGVVYDILNRNINTNYSIKKYASLYESKDFNVNELNNFVGAKVNVHNRSEISKQAYYKCMNAGFKFCRVPISLVTDNRKSKQSWSGSGFLISANGHILTNEHVAGKCKKIVVQPMNLQAKLVAKDSSIDLAVLKVQGDFKDYATFSVNTAVLGEQVVAAGFPYKQLLSSSIKISTGIISSLAGVLDDNKVVQITAPIQPGNSGGPLIDTYGNVVAVIVSKLDSKLMLKVMDDIPQNVNFAIKAKNAKEFLLKYNIPFKQKAPTIKYDIPAISKAAETYTVEINCTN